MTGGTVTLDGKDLLALTPEERAVAGLFLGFQYPVEIPGVGNLYFLRTALNAQRKARGEEELDAMDFLGLAKEKMKLVEMDPAFMNRASTRASPAARRSATRCCRWRCSSPGSPSSTRSTAASTSTRCAWWRRGVKALRSPDRSTILVTHYQRLLEYIVPDRVHVMAAGRIVLSGGRELALELEKKGYAWVES